MPDIDDDSLDLLPGIVKGLQAYIEELDTDLDHAVGRITALEVGPSSAHNKHQPWVVTATDAEWAELAAWVDWLNENYELTSNNDGRISKLVNIATSKVKETSNPNAWVPPKSENT